jgi:hypothetical protein
MVIGEGVVELAYEPLDVLWTALEGATVWLVGYVAIEDLVHYLQVALVPSLLQVTPEGGLVLFFGGHSFLLLPEPLPLGRVMAHTDVASRRSLAHLVKVYSPNVGEEEFSEVHIQKAA